jgi:hypothetical protein
MRDYYPLVARAVSRLEYNTPSAREALFDHLRLILIDQLRIRQPSALPTEIMGERAALESAIQKIQPIRPTPGKRPTEPPRAPTIARSGNDAPSSTVDESAVNLLPLPLSRNDITAGLTVRADNFAHQDLATRDRRDRRLRDVLARMQAIPVDQQRVEQRPGLSTASVPGDRAPIEHGIPRVKPVTGGNAVPPAESVPLQPPQSPNDITTQRTATRNEPSRGATVGEPLRRFADSANTAILDNLAGIQLLDQLLLDASNPLAPDNLKQDAEAVLKWLGIGEQRAIKIEHYDQFGRAIRTHMTKATTSSSKTALGAEQVPSPLVTDEISRVFDRLLDEQQSAMVFDKALTWFADIWIKLIIALNFVVIVALLASASTPLNAVIHLAKTFSPLNVWTWIAEVVALSPALGAIAWRDRRLTGSWDVTLLTVILSLRELLLRQTRLRSVTERRRGFITTRLRPRAAAT